MSTTIKGMSLADIRVFAGEHNIKLSRINILVGENSIGKTTLLGNIYALAHLANFKDLADGQNYLNRRPIPMGDFKNLIRSGCQSFKIGIDLRGSSLSKFLIEYDHGNDGSLREKRLELHHSGSSNNQHRKLSISHNESIDSPQWIFEGPEFSFQLDQPHVSYQQFSTWLSQSVRYGNLPYSGQETIYRKQRGQISIEQSGIFVKFVNYFRHEFRLPESLLNVIAIEPNSLKPQVQYPYDPLNGIDVEHLSEIGRKLGLFQKIRSQEVKNSMFEIIVELKGSEHNLQYVGYGIPSVLPTLCELVKAPANSVFLLQQPEVHIHPSSQAALVQTIAKTDHTFFIETHSDHIIDWFRILVVEKTLSHTDVSIIYLQDDPEDGSATCVYPIQLDELANLLGCPPFYREFFTDQTMRLLTL